MKILRCCKSGIFDRRICAYVLTAVLCLNVLTGCHVDKRIYPETAQSIVGNSESSITLEMLSTLYTNQSEALDSKHQALYEEIMMKLLQEDLWTERDMYDACHYLMVPMHYAFYSGSQDIIHQFADFFWRFTEDITGEDQYEFENAGSLNRMQFFYLCTQFMNLCAAKGNADLIPQELPKLIQEYSLTQLFKSAPNWRTENTVLEHLKQVLAGKEYKYRYYSTIMDSDLFILALLCDLNCLARLCGEIPNAETEIAADLAYQIFSSPHLISETEKGGWLLQPGVMSDHADMSYAGNEKIYEGIQPCLRDDVPMDSSHSTRLGLFLRSFQSGQEQKEKWELFALRQEQFANQMANYVLKNVDGNWLMTTFIDGTNGVYRY